MIEPHTEQANKGIDLAYLVCLPPFAASLYLGSEDLRRKPHAIEAELNFVTVDRIHDDDVIWLKLR